MLASLALSVKRLFYDYKHYCTPVCSIEVKRFAFSKDYLRRCQLELQDSCRAGCLSSKVRNAIVIFKQSDLLINAASGKYSHECFMN